MNRSGWRSSCLVLLTATAVYACSPGQVPTEAVPAQPGLLRDLTSGLRGTLSALLLNCRPLPYQVVQQTVTSEGATLRIGPHTLTIPGGAVSGSVLITAEIPSEPVNSIRFQPEGLRFAKSTQLTMSYANCEGLLAPKKIAYTTDLLRILELLSSSDNASSRTVSAPVEHFSRYAVAW